MIDKTKQSSDGTASLAMLENALDLVRPNATIFGLKEILDRLTEKGFYEAAVELCGLAALQSDPQNYAVRHAIDNEVPANATGKNAVEQRHRYYGMITKILSDLEAMASPRGVGPQQGGIMQERNICLSSVCLWEYTYSLIH